MKQKQKKNNKITLEKLMKLLDSSLSKDKENKLRTELKRFKNE
jgi:hypothetical protein